MNKPNVVRLAASDTKGNPISLTVANDIIDHMEAARTFGREDLADPTAHGRFQRRVLAVPDRQSGVATPMMFTIGSLNGLSLVRKDETADGGWKAIDLGASFASAVGGAPQVVRAVGVGWTDDDRITVAVAVDAAPGLSQSRVFAAFNLPGAATDWGQVPWIDCGTRESVSVEGIRVLDEGNGAWTVVLAGSQGPTEAVYLLRSDRLPSFAGALVFNSAVTMQEILDFQIGVHPVYGSGLHVLGLSGGNRVLTFRPFPNYDSTGKPGTIPPVVILPCPDGANVLESGATTEDGTNLYIGGQGLYLIPAAEQDNDEIAQTIQLMAAEAASGIQNVIAGETADGSASVWALLQNGDLIVVKRTGADAAWGPSLRLRSGVQEMAAIPGDRHATTSILAVYSDAHAGYVWQDGGSGVWQEAPIHIADPEQAMMATCYGTSLRVLDSAGAPRQGVKVSVTASVLSSVSLNGNAALIAPDAAVEAVTDMNGSITVFNRVRSLTPAVYRFAVDGVDGQLDVNPSAGVFNRFKTMTADELRGATVGTPDGDVPLLPDNFRTGSDQGQVDAVAASLNQGADLALSADGAAPGVRVVAANAAYSSQLRADTVPDTYRWGIQADAQGVRTLHDDAVSKLIGAVESAEHFFVNLGHTIADFFEGIGDRLKEGLTFVLHKAQGVFEFVCAIGDKIKKFALSTLEEAGAFFTWLWAQMKTGLEKLWDYLKFLFEWEDIILVRNAMVEATDEALAALRNAVGQMKDGVSVGFDKALAQIGSWRAEAGGVPPVKPRRPASGGSLLDDIGKATAPVQALLDQVAGNSVVAWVTQRIGKLADDIVHFEGPNPASEALEAAEQFVAGLVSDETNDLLATWDQLQADIIQLFDGEMPRPSELSFDAIRDALVAVGSDVLEGVLTGLRDFVLRVIDLLEQLLGVVRDSLFTKVSFPFIEKLANLVVPGTHIDTSFRLIDSVMLLCAIPATIGYKLIAGEAPFKKGDVLPFAFGQVTVQSGADGLRKYSWAAGLAGAFVKMLIAGYRTFTQAGVAVDGGQAPQAKAWQLWVGAAFGGVGAATEFLSRHTGKGEDFSALEWTMQAISSVMSIKTIALLIAENKSGADPGKLRKISSGLDVVGYVAHFILRTAVFRKVIEQDNQSGDSDEKMTETLAWMESFFDHAGSAFGSGADLDDDPETKAILIGLGAGGKGLAFVLDLVRVPITMRKQQMLTY
ncbi:hypothetical protein [Paenibacillus tyrfis]|uniref:hypothetical protein n=1 Tax=Paenibacillus tyrfis TaxID=1501230 RepID=UPI000B596BE2|nr:hypothetical protein [Paenibacillus tyrfis]